MLQKNHPPSHWALHDKDPNNKALQKVSFDYLKEIYRSLIETKKSFLNSFVSGMRLLDIGIVEHSLVYADQPDWEHAQLRAAASYTLGVDILENEVGVLRERGYNVLALDATSDAFIGEMFDRITIGDVIEHVDNPVKLLQFGSRHLASNGLLLISTPNPHWFLTCLRALYKPLAVPNLDHVRWVSPPMALELGHRANLELISIIGVSGFEKHEGINKYLGRLMEKLYIQDFQFAQTFIYVYAHPGRASVE